jgi:type IV pilus assembly protein PilC
VDAETTSAGADGLIGSSSAHHLSILNMRFVFTAVNSDGEEKSGTIEAFNEDAAISSLQRRGLTILSIESEEDSVPIWERRIKFFESVSNREIVIFSRQIATLFQADVSALKVFRLLANATDNLKLRDALEDIVSDLKGGSNIADAMEAHDDIFSEFYVNMVRSGEETGQLSETFLYLADYLDRNYELVNKTKNALIYPAFVIMTFVGVMVLMLTTIIPNITQIIEASDQEPPVYTQFVMGLSDFLVNYGFYLLVPLVLTAYGLWWYTHETEDGQRLLSVLKIQTPYIGNLYQKLYLSRIADNMNTMLSSGITMTRGFEITASIISNDVFTDILRDAIDDIKSGKSVADALDGNDEIPNIMVQMIRIGEETGELKSILETLSDFYRREVENAVDSLVGLIEPAMILLLGLGVGGLLASVLMPIYNISSGI